MQVSVDAGDAEDPPPPSSPPTVVSDLVSYAVPPAYVIGLGTCPMPASFSGVTSAFHGFCNFGLPDQHYPSYFPSLPFPTFNQFGMATSTHPSQIHTGNMCSFQDLLRSASSGLLMPQSCPDNVQITPTGPSESDLCFNSSPGDNAQIPYAMPSESDLCFNSSPGENKTLETKINNINGDISPRGPYEVFSHENGDSVAMENEIDESGYFTSGSSVYDVDSDNDSDCLDVFRQTDSCSASKVNKHPELAKDLFNEKTQDINPITNENATEDACEETPWCECINGNPYMHVITDELPEEEQEGVGWKKRKTTKKGERRVRSDCRIPKGMGPIEIAMRNAPKRKTKYIFEPVLGLTFDSEDEAFEFYNMYSYEAGFGIKKSTLKKNDKKFQTLRELRCLCSGGDDRVEYKTKKTGCQAMIRLHRTSDDGWFISCIRSEHNHPLTETCGETKEWFSHKKIDQSTKDMIKYLRENNVSLTKVNCIMGSIFGSMHNSPLTKRSLRTICSQIAKDQMDDDVQKTLEVRNVRRREWPVEEHAMTFYTAAAYDLFRKEVDKSSHYFAKEEIKNKLYTVLHVKPLSKPSWAQQSYMVEIKNDGESYECQCGLYQHFGILCSHVIRVMVQLGISEIPEAHIMKRWTYKAIDVLPGELSIYQEDRLSMQSMTFRHSYLYVNGMKNVNDGNRDINAFKIVAHYQKKAQKKLAQYFKTLEASEKEATTAKKNKHVDRVSELEHQYYTTGSESGSDIDIPLGNTYGASGSSACMSDTELQNIKAPSYKRKPGRPKATRFKSSADEANRKKRKGSRRNTDDGQEEDQLQQQRKKIRCGSCDIIGHSSTSCKKKIVDVNSEIPEC
ncbi:hypothetical protein EJB05_10216 [Eragrostis curvula]|uniref:SWIM-type domain-containing protein n=1 Tax=Eragrostis curvula TaxID=38414 RepID=A0A5J9W6G3_9POAL|nr:hypothetical protein EJB05_10216 [Eragrostis curvula]